MADDCGKCKIKLKRNEIKLHCSGKCDKYYHTECAKIKSEEYQLIYSNKNIRWFCDKCNMNFDFMNKLYNDMADFKDSIKEEIKIVKELIQTTSEQNKEEKAVENKKSYAEVTGEVMLIKPKAVQECKKTKETVCKSLNPSELGVGIKQLKEIKDGGILIKCNTREEIDKIKKAADKKLNENYNIRTPTQKNPKIKIVDINDQMSDEKLLNCILSQNEFLNHEDKYFKVVTTKKMKTKYMSIIECDPLSFELIRSKGKICVGWSVCRVFEYVPVLRCFKCGVFGHKSSDCETEEKCLKCGKQDHLTKECVSEQLSCCNCIIVNSKFKLNLKIDHSTFDINCPSYQNKVDLERRKIRTENK